MSNFHEILSRDRNLLDIYIKNALDTFEVPGLAFVIVKDNSVVLANGYGSRGEGLSPVDEETVFPVGSITKSFTAISLGILVDEKKIRWDDRVKKFLPKFELNSLEVTNEITIRDLLTHRSGLSTSSGGIIWYGSNYTRDEVLSRLKFLKNLSGFKSEFKYNNEMYIVAGQIILALTGKSWDDFIKERIFSPLEMKSSSTSINVLKLQPNIAIPHVKRNNQIKAVSYRSYDNAAPCGAINSNVLDLSQYLKLIINKGIYNKQKIISEDTLNEILSPQIKMTNLPEKNDFYGLGWVISKFKGHNVIAHAGSVDGFVASLVYLPENKLCFALMANLQEDPGASTIAAINRRLLDISFNLESHDYISELKNELTKKERMRDEDNAKTIIERKQGTAPSHSLSEFTGIFRDELYGDVNVKKVGEHLIISFSHTPSFVGTLDHWHYNKFRVIWTDSVLPEGFIEFILNSEKEIEKIKIEEPYLEDVSFSVLDLRKVIL